MAVSGNAPGGGRCYIGQAPHLRHDSHAGKQWGCWGTHLGGQALDVAGHALAEKGGCHVPCLHHASRVYVVVCHVAAEACSGIILVLEKVQCCHVGLPACL